jgi:hypothetical protein
MAFLSKADIKRALLDQPAALGWTAFQNFEPPLFPTIGRVPVEIAARTNP